MEIKEIAERVSKRIYVEDGLLLSKFISEKFAETLIAELAKQNEPVAINEPNYHYEAMGCGLEDRGITDRYEAMEYGWNCAIERMFEQLPEDQLYTFPPTPEQIAEGNEPCAFLHEWIEYHPFGDTFAGEPCAAITSDEKPFDSSDTVSPLFTFPPTAEQIANETAEACARYVNRFINGDGILNEVWISEIEEALRNGAWKEFK